MKVIKKSNIWCTNLNSSLIVFFFFFFNKIGSGLCSPNRQSCGDHSFVLAELVEFIKTCCPGVGFKAQSTHFGRVGVGL